MSSVADVLILGGGVVGLTTAWELARLGLRVTLLDKGDLGQQASWAGAGIIPPGNIEAAHTPYERLRAFSVARMANLSRHLLDITGIDNGYRISGALELLDSSDATDEWRAPGVRAEWLDAAGLRRREPGLASRCREGYYLPDAAQVRNPWHLRALIAACQEARVALHPNLAGETLLASGDRIEGVLTPAGTFQAGRVLVASGAWSGGLLAQVGCTLAVKPIRGQIALLNTGVEGLRPLLLEGHRYIVPRGDGRFLVGSSEEDVGFDTRTTAQVIAELLGFAVGVLPALKGASVERCWAGLRPGSADGAPYLGLVPGWRNLYVAAGHYRSGILLSPGTAVLLAALLTDQRPALDLEHFRVEREITAG
jgi:glycine oxidase